MVHSSMNYMRIMQDESRLRDFSILVGQFIRYWGFRNIHGQIWAVVYLSDKPLSGVELAKILRVSKALVSLGLKELEAERLIEECHSENAKTKRYRAVHEVGPIIRGVLERRETPLLDKIQKSFQKFEGKPQSGFKINPERGEKLGVMIALARVALGEILAMEL